MIATGILAQLSDPTRPTTLPIAIPASLASSYALGANTKSGLTTPFIKKDNLQKGDRSRD
jgi:hypothetical protein